MSGPVSPARHDVKKVSRKFGSAPRNKPVKFSFTIANLILVTSPLGNGFAAGCEARALPRRNWLYY